MTVNQPSSKLVSDMKQLGWTMLQDWQKKAGPEGESIVQAYLKTPTFGSAPAPAGKSVSSKQTQPVAGKSSN
jgi:hypothetical protein